MILYFLFIIVSSLLHALHGADRIPKILVPIVTIIGAGILCFVSNVPIWNSLVGVAVLLAGFVPHRYWYTHGKRFGHTVTGDELNLPKPDAFERIIIQIADILRLSPAQSHFLSHTISWNLPLFVFIYTYKLSNWYYIISMPFLITISYEIAKIIVIKDSNISHHQIRIAETIKGIFWGIIIGIVIYTY